MTEFSWQLGFASAGYRLQDATTTKMMRANLTPLAKRLALNASVK